MRDQFMQGDLGILVTTMPRSSSSLQYSQFAQAMVFLYGEQRTTVEKAAIQATMSFVHGGVPGGNLAGDSSRRPHCSSPRFDTLCRLLGSAS